MGQSGRCRRRILATVKKLWYSSDCPDKTTKAAVFYSPTYRDLSRAEGRTFTGLRRKSSPCLVRTTVGVRPSARYEGGHMSRRIAAYWTKWRLVTTVFGDMCFYCREDVAACLDHVLPYSYVNNGDVDNLRPSCALCNAIAGNMIFETEGDKRIYILGKRQRRKETRHCSCTQCGAPYIFREQSPSQFLCPECYDAEYGTHEAERCSWDDWLKLLDQAGMSIEIYRTARSLYMSEHSRGRKWLKMCLIEAIRLTEARYTSPLTDENATGSHYELCNVMLPK